jgi:hypothetical protein
VLIGFRQELAPTWILISDQGEYDIIGTPWVNTTQQRLACTQAYSLVVEAWTAKAPEGWQPGEPRVAPCQDPERKETVLASQPPERTREQEVMNGVPVIMFFIVIGGLVWLANGEAIWKWAVGTWVWTVGFVKMWITAHPILCKADF